tara:strand:+ start:676 stop:846 length:171 start_codon:yes stop_codon:yes gene_type:complete
MFNLNQEIKVLFPYYNPNIRPATFIEYLNDKEALVLLKDTAYDEVFKVNIRRIIND